MNIIEEFIEKHQGKFLQNPKKSFYVIGKKYSCQDGEIVVDGTKISVNFTEVSDAVRTTEPFRIILYFDRLYDIDFEMFPKSWWGKIKDLFFPKRVTYIPQKVRKQFYFSGNPKIFKELANSKTFVEDILFEMIYIRIIHKKTSRVVLTPAYGIYDVEHLEKLISILKQIEKTVKKQLN
ncbi:hypothetical protein [Kordia zhangzhouensis]|uniref:hypothetical protein n=1 Tax=Kordia zhangzhouensis TaxID=1620405 RepID=UPI000628FB24|nr:hypothetical protein [Kordia zhangzhouensis]